MFVSHQFLPILYKFQERLKGMCEMPKSHFIWVKSNAVKFFIWGKFAPIWVCEIPKIPLAKNSRKALPLNTRPMDYVR